MFVTRINRKRHDRPRTPTRGARKTPKRSTKKKAEGNSKSNEGGSTNIRPKYHYQYPSGNPMKEHAQSIGTAHSSLSHFSRGGGWRFGGTLLYIIIAMHILATNTYLAPAPMGATALYLRKYVCTCMCLGESAALRQRRHSERKRLLRPAAERKTISATAG